MFDVAAHTIFVTLAGSQAHGTARAGSDVDLRGVCIAPLKVRLSLFEKFEQSEAPLEGELWTTVRERLLRHPTASAALETKVESVVFDLGKFVGLLAVANPNFLEILFADERDWVFETPWWRRLHEQRHRFLTQKVQQTFLGYALAQLKRIKTHRGWLLTPPKAKPSRQDFGLPETSTLNQDDQRRIGQGIEEKLRDYGFDATDLPGPDRSALKQNLRAFWVDSLGAKEEELEERIRAVAGRAVSLPPEVISTLNAERKYRAALKHWQSYQAWKGHRNRDRAELERKFGYDTKHAMHLVRLMRMGLEALQTGDLLIRRPDAEELNSIRQGAWEYDRLLEQAEGLQARIRAAVQETSLPADIDRAAVDELTLDLLSEFEGRGAK
ncbi:MAG: nucleotidyltransferase domain-containing protein [Deltaproteobacteria bacterium]|nr:nucleotidyltransferase domain-containing protein [Deltaproteobacteria bacterium]